MVRACFYAWHHVAMRNHWLTAYTASHMLERRNNGKIVKGGGMSYRVGKKFENELGINLKKMISLDVHVVADTEHSENISEMFERYVKTPKTASWCCKAHGIRWRSIAPIAARSVITWSRFTRCLLTRDDGTFCISK